MLRAAFATVMCLAVLTVGAACATAEGSRAPLNARDPAWPEVGEASASVSFARLAVADAGLPFVATGRANGLPAGAALAIDFGDGTTAQALVGIDGQFRAEHRYARAGGYPVTARTTAGRTGYARAELEVRPRYVVFVQGMNSESRCPGGARFADRAPAWVRDYLQAGGAAAEYRYFSYSGRFCGGGDGSDGAAADYSGDDTCDGVALYAGRLRAMIDAADGMVTVVAHSMGGLLAAYVAAAEPAWAREHIASVVTFDSPLGGLDTARRTVLGGYSLFEGGCGRGSQSMKDLDGGSEVVALAKQAGMVLPFYTLDGDDGESQVFGIAQAVPGDRTRIEGEVAHTAVEEKHSEVWSRPPDTADGAKAQFVLCAVALADACGRP